MKSIVDSGSRHGLFRTVHHYRACHVAHVLFANLHLGGSLFAVVTLSIYLKNKKGRYNRLARSVTLFNVILFSTGATFAVGGVLFFISLYPEFATNLFHLYWWPLLIEAGWNVTKKPIVVGIDGSEESYHALNKALGLAEKLGCGIIVVAVYDPFFHATVFQKIADVLPPKDQEKFNFTAQEKLHDEIIDDGLEKVYRDGRKGPSCSPVRAASQARPTCSKGRSIPRYAITPAFHRKMAESKARGAIVQNGNRIMNYIVVSTEPPGPVRITADTTFGYEKPENSNKPVS